MRSLAGRILLGVLTLGLLAAALTDAGKAGFAPSPRIQLTMIAPAAPGGGWDTFAREAQQGLTANGVVNAVRVMNVPGAAGTIGLNQFVRMEGRQDIMMVTGGVMIGGVILQDSDATLDDVTPIARLADDYNVLVVPADSPHETFADFAAAWRAEPGTAIAGGSLGSIDHLLTGQLAGEIGVAAEDVNYIAYAGGGEVVRALLSGSATAGISGYNDFRDQIEIGELRALGVSAAEPLADVPIPTFIESGVDVSMSNWRGFLAPAGIPVEIRDEMVTILGELRETEEWQDTLARNGWTDEFMTGAEFEEYLDVEVTLTEEIIRELGL